MNVGYVLPNKARHIKEIYQSAFPKKEDLKAEYVKNGIILPWVSPNKFGTFQGLGGVLDGEGQYVEASGHQFLVEGGYIPEHVQSKRGKAVYCGRFHMHWGHFLIDDVSRLWIVNGLSAGNVEYYVFTKEAGDKRNFSGNYLAFFRLLGIESKIRLIDQPMRFDEVIVPEVAYERGKHYSAEFVEIFEKVSQKAMQAACVNAYPIHKKIYFSRKLQKKVNVSEFGGDAIERFFENNGYYLLIPEQLQLEEMIWYIRHAEEVACLSGTIPHNMLFGLEGQKVVICEKNCTINECQIDVDRIKGLDVTYLDANITSHYAGALSFCLCYNNRLDQWAKGQDMVRGKLLVDSHREYRRLMRKYDRACRSIIILPDAISRYLDEYLEAFEDALATYAHIRIYSRLGEAFWRIKCIITNKGISVRTKIERLHELFFDALHS